MNVENFLWSLLSGAAQAFPTAFKAVVTDRERVEKLIEIADQSVPDILDFTDTDAVLDAKIEAEGELESGAS